MDLGKEHITSNGYCADCDNLLWIVKSDQYAYTLKKHKFWTYKTKIIKPKDIEILHNGTDLNTRELKKYIVQRSFAECNEQVRKHNNTVAKIRRQKRRTQ